MPGGLHSTAGSLEIFLVTSTRCPPPFPAFHSLSPTSSSSRTTRVFSLPSREGPDQEMGQLSWSHHTVVQALLSRGPLPEKEVRTIFSGVSGKNAVIHQQLFNGFLLKINKELAYVQLELRGCRNQYDGEVYYGVVNNVADKQSKLGSKYLVPQIAFYKGITEAILLDTAVQGSITNITALNTRLENQVQSSQGSQGSQATTFKNFTLSHKERTLKDLMHDGWLCSTLNGDIGLGMRSFLDLRSWFRSNDIPACEVCNEAGIKADTCTNKDCPVRIHSYCLEKKFSQKKVARTCPRCGTSWNVSEPFVKVNSKENSPYKNQVTVCSLPTKKLRGCKMKAAKVDWPQTRDLPFNDSTLRKKVRSCKTEAAKSGQPQTLSTLRKKVRSCKTEAAESGQPQTHSTLRKKVSSCKTEAAESGQPQTQQLPTKDSTPRKKPKSCKAEMVDKPESKFDWKGIAEFQVPRRVRSQRRGARNL